MKVRNIVIVFWFILWGITCSFVVHGQDAQPEKQQTQSSCKGGTLDKTGKCSCDEGDLLMNEGKDNEICICDASKKCCGIELNTVIPFIGDCIELGLSTNNFDPNKTVVNSITAFPILAGGIVKILTTAILIFSFLMIIVGGVMMTMGGVNSSSYSTGKGYISKVLIGLAILGMAGTILKLVNPNFFG